MIGPTPLQQPKMPPAWQATALRIGLQAFSHRALVWSSAICGAAIWGLAALDPTVLRLVAAAGYCLTVLVPILVRDARGGGTHG